MSRIPLVSRRLGEMLPRAELHERVGDFLSDEVVVAGLADTVGYDKISLHRPSFDFVLEWDNGAEQRVLYEAYTPLYDPVQVARGNTFLGHSWHARYPEVAREGTGVLRVLSPTGESVRASVRPAHFVPESKNIAELLREMQTEKFHMAIVVDEYGGVAGLITIEDVIEQIIGEIDDEFDVEDDQNIRADGERQFVVRGATRIAEFNEHFGTSFSDGEFDTVAGLVMQQLGRVPRRGEAVTIGGFEFRVLRTDRRRIDSLHVAPVRLATAAS